MGSQSPYLSVNRNSPYDFWSFLRLKTELKGRQFGTLDRIKSAETDKLKVTRKIEFQHSYKK